MTYRINGPEVELELSEEEIGDVIRALVLTVPGSELVEAFQEFQKENGFA